MATKIQRVFNFLENYGEYTNRQGVRFETITLSESCAGCRYPGFVYNNDGPDLLLYIEDSPFQQLMVLLDITSIQDVRQIRPEKILELYDQYKAKLICTVMREDVHCIFFEKTVEGFICQDEYNKFITPENPLENAGDYIWFTETYYNMKH